MTEPETEEFSCELIVKPALCMMQARLPMQLVSRTNDYIDSVRDSAADQSKSLVGQIRQNPRSAQLGLDMRERFPSDLANEIAAIGAEYIKAQGFRAVVTPTVIWSVHSYQGDYNPLHDHGGRTPLGLSSILYLMVPPVIAAKDAVADGGAPKLNMASGNSMVSHNSSGARPVCGISACCGHRRKYVKPEVGKLIIFPNWLLHRVEPFFGEGERRTLSCNMDVVFDEPDWY